jgi:2-keto-3-deoxy-L-rhamnonate aldolase RhmA
MDWKTEREKHMAAEVSAIKEGKVSLGFCLSYPAAGMIENIGRFSDWAWIDGQHGQLSDDVIMECIRTADGMGLPSVVRIPGGSFHRIGPVLDMGATGIMVPMIESRQQVDAVVKEFFYAPKGNRSFGGSRVCDLFGADYYQRSMENQLLVVQIENTAGLENVEAIAAAEGVDILFFGPGDMRLSMGLPLETPLDHPGLLHGMRTICRAAKEHGKAAGTVALAPKDLELCLKEGFSFFVSYADTVDIAQSAAARFGEMRKAAGEGK